MAKKEFYLFNFLLINICLTYKEWFSIFLIIPFILLFINFKNLKEEFFELSYLFINGILFSYLFISGIKTLEENIAIVFFIAFLFWGSLNLIFYLFYRVFKLLKNLMQR